MADPTPYSRTYSFTDYQSGNPSAPLPGAQVDNELENIEQSLGEAIDALGDIRRSDGKLNNGIVTVDSLDAQVAAGVGTGALASAAAAAASAGAAADSAEAAASSAGAAAGSATTASGYAGNALTSRNEAETERTLAQAARDYANKWATEAEDVNVDDGVNPVGRSAYHWSQKAAASAASVDLPPIVADTLLGGNTAGDAWETKTPAEVRDLLGVDGDVATRTALKALDTAKYAVAYLLEAGREGHFKWQLGDYSAQITADTAEGIYIKADAVAATSGAWVRQGGWALTGGFAEWFGAVADYDESDGSGTDNDAAINAALSLLPVGYLAGGYYRTENTVALSPYKSLICLSGGMSNPVGDTDYFVANKRATIVPRNLPRVHTIASMITQCELSGGLVANPSAAESYTTSSSGRLANYSMMDFTNQDASGATQATQRAFSVAVKIERGAKLDGVSVRTTRANGNFVSDAADTDFGNQCDIGVLGMNAFFASVKNGVFSWAFRDAAILVVTDEISGDSPDYYPQTDRLAIENCYIEGHCGVAVRGPDAVRVSAVDATTITVKWFKSHRFAATGSVTIGGVAYTYSSLTFGSGNLVFGGLSANPVSGGVTVGDALYRTADVRTYGTGGVSVTGCFIRSISHPSLKPSTDGAFTDYFPMCGRNIELGGLGVRGIHFDKTYIHGREDVSFFANYVGDVYFCNCYHEAKYLAAGAGSNVSRFVALGMTAKAARSIPQPVGETGDIHFVLWSQTEGGTDMRPRYRTTSNYGRFGTGADISDGLFEPSRSTNDAYDWGATNEEGARVFRAPSLRDSRHPIQWHSALGTVRASMDNDGRWGFGFGMDTSTDYTYAFNILYGANSVANIRNGSTTAISAWRAENTAGNAWFGVDTDGFGLLRSNNVSRLKFGPNKFNPASDNNMDLGTASTGRFRDAFFVNAPTVTSDARDKEWLGGLADAELRIAKKLSSLVGLFKWLHAIEEKGADAARIHAGVTVQSVVAAFEAEGLDAMRYGIVGHDVWEGGDRYSLRPDELWAFVAAGFEARLSVLEA